MKTTRRFFLAGLATSAVITPAAGTPVVAPTREDMEHYYAFLWAEFRALSLEMGVDICDSHTAHKSGGIAAYDAAFGGSLPSTRALAAIGRART